MALGTKGYMFSEALWIFVVLAAWIAGFQLLRHYRRKTAGDVNNQAFKGRLAAMGQTT